MRRRRLTIIVHHMRRLLPWTNLKRFLGGLNTLRIPDGMKISPRSSVAVSRSMQRTPRAAFYARLEFQMILSIASSRRGVGRMDLMEQPTIPRWTSKRRFLSLALQGPELALGNPRRLMGS